MSFKNKLSLTEDEADILGDIIFHDGYRPLVKLMNHCADAMAQDVLNLDLGAASDRDIAVKKARYDGARKLIANFEQIVDKKKKAKTSSMLQ